VTASGLPWLPNGTGSFRVEVFASNILCSRHNLALSPLDSAALQLFQVLQKLRATSESAELEPRSTCELLVNGHDIERWCLKVLMGGLFSGNMRVPDASLKRVSPPRRYLEFLFGDRAQVKPWGLFVLNPHESVLSAGAYVSITVLSAGPEPAGLLLQLNGLQLAFVPKNVVFSHSDGRVFRPSELHIMTPAGARIIALSWERPGSNEAVLLAPRLVAPAGIPVPPHPSEGPSQIT